MGTLSGDAAASGAGLGNSCAGIVSCTCGACGSGVGCGVVAAAGCGAAAGAGCGAAAGAVSSGKAAGTGADGATFSSTGTEVALGTAEDSGVAEGVATGTTVGSGVDIGGVTDGEAVWEIGVVTAIAFLMGTGSAFRMRTGVGLGVGVENAGEAGNAGIAGVISPPGSDDEPVRVASRRFASSARTWYPAPKGMGPAFIPERYAPSSCGSRRSLKIGRGSV